VDMGAISTTDFSVLVSILNIIPEDYTIMWPLALCYLRVHDSLRYPNSYEVGLETLPYLRVGAHVSAE